PLAHGLARSTPRSGLAPSPDTRRNRAPTRRAALPPPHPDARPPRSRAPETVRRLTTGRPRVGRRLVAWVSDKFMQVPSGGRDARLRVPPRRGGPRGGGAAP